MTSSESTAPRPAPRARIPTATGNPILPPDHSLLKAAWLAIALGFAIEGLNLLAAVVSGGALAARPYTADLVQKVAWSFIVCVALAVARTAARAAAPLIGLAGLLAAPLGYAVARGLHQGASQALGLAAASASGPSPVLVAAIKGCEYAALGLLVYWVARKSWGGIGAHTAVGGAVGLLFGGPLLALALGALPQLTASAVLARGVDELVFPVGCALVLYASDTLGKRLA